MDHKSNWLWRKKSTEKTILSSDHKTTSHNSNNDDEIQTLLTEKAELEKDLKSLNDKLSCVQSECKAKDDLVKKQEKMTDEATEGWKKADAKAVSLKQELDEALKQRTDAEDRLAQVEAALKECMQQLRFVREEQERRIHDAVTKASREFEKSEMILEEKLAEAGKRLAKISGENTSLNKAILAKEKSIEDLTKQKAQVEADLKALMARLESTEKDNSSLKYEVRVLEKEVEIRNEEGEFNRRTADAAHKQHLDSVKKIAKLEAECQRLRVLVRKRLPGPAALAKMKSEVDNLGRDSTEMRRRRMNCSPNGFHADIAVDNSMDADALNKQISFLTEQFLSMEEENKNLKEALNKKVNELQTSRDMYARAASKLAQVDLHSDGQSKTQTSFGQPKSGFPSHELSLARMSDVGSDDKISSAESWASALISELEHFKHGKQRDTRSGKTVGGSDINLMDDFLEMERLAIVSVDQQSVSPQVSSEDANAPVSPIQMGTNGHSSEITGKEIIPFEYGSGASEQDIKSKAVQIGKSPDWLQDILKAVLEQTRIMQTSPDKILEDVKVALADISNGKPGESADASNSTQVAGYLSWKPTDNSMLIDSSCGINDDDALLADRNNQLFQSELGRSMQKIIEHAEAIISSKYATSEAPSIKDGTLIPYKNETSSGFLVRVFQWKMSELNAVLQQFVHACYDLLSGKSDVNSFVQELSSAVDWMVNRCFSLQDVSSMKDEIKKHFDWDETRSDGEPEIGVMSQSSEADKSCLSSDHLSVSNGAFERKDLEGKLQSAIDKNETLTKKLQEFEKTISSLQTELRSTKMSKALNVNQNGSQSLTREDIDTKLTAAKAELNEAHQRICSLETEIENKSSCYEELEATCLELQLQVESATKKDIANDEEEKQLRTDWEITAASEKLAECQETILNLGKQLKALAAPSEAGLFDKVISNSPDRHCDSVSRTISSNAPKSKLANQRSSLLDQMVAEDNAKVNHTGSPKIEESNKISSSFVSNGAIQPLERVLSLNRTTKRLNDNVAVRSLAIVPGKKKGSGNLWKKLLWRKKKSSNKKPTFLFSP